MKYINRLATALWKSFGILALAGLMTGELNVFIIGLILLVIFFLIEQITYII